MNENAGQITVILKMDDKQFNTVASKADNTANKLTKSLEKKTTEATARMEERFESLGNTIRSSLQIGAVALGVAGVASVKMAGDFEKSLNILRSVSSANNEEMKKLADRAVELGKDITLPGISARDAAGAMTELAKAGVNVNDVLTASQGVLSLAKAGQLDVKSAATITARALNSFGLTGDKASMVADVLAAGANASSAEVIDLAYAMAQSGASANRMGITLQDTVAAIAMFSNAGIVGSDAGTSLKTMLQRLAAPTKESSKIMETLGLSFFDANGNFIGLGQTAENLKEKLSVLTQEHREQAITAMFGADSSRVAGILAEQGATGFDNMSKSVNRAGAATDLAAAQNEGLAGALDNLRSVLETIGIRLANELLPPLTEFIQQLTNKLEPTVDFLIKNRRIIIGTIVAIGVAFTAIRIAGFVSDLAQTSNILKMMVGAKNINGIMALGKAFKFLSLIIMANPIIAIITAIVAILAYLQLRFNIFGKMLDWLKEITSEVSIFVINTFLLWYQSVKDIVNRIIDVVGGIGVRIFNKLRNMGSLLYNSGRDLIQGFLNGARSLLSTVGQFFLNSLPKWIREPFKRALGISSPSKIFADYGKNIIQGLSGGIGNNANLAISAAQKIANDISGIGFGLGGIGLSDGDFVDIGHANRSPVVNLILNNSGIVARSRSDLREITKDMIEAVNEELRAKQLPQIGGGAL